MQVIRMKLSIHKVINDNILYSFNKNIMTYGYCGGGGFYNPFNPCAPCAPSCGPCGPCGPSYCGPSPCAPCTTTCCTVSDETVNNLVVNGTSTLVGAVTTSGSLTVNGPLTLKKSTVTTGTITVTGANTATGAAAITTKNGTITFTVTNAGASTFATNTSLALTLTGTILPANSLMIAQVQSHTTVGKFIVVESVSAAGSAVVTLGSMDGGTILTGTTIVLTYMTI